MISHQAEEGEAALFHDSRLFGFNPKFKYFNVLANAEKEIMAELLTLAGPAHSSWNTHIFLCIWKNTNVG